MSYARRHSTNVCPGNRVRYTCSTTFPGMVHLTDQEFEAEVATRAAAGVSQLFAVSPEPVQDQP